MSKQDIFDKLKPVLALSLSREESHITLQSNLKDDLGADSLDVVQTATDIEKEFDVIFTDAEMEKISTVQDIVDILFTHKSVQTA